MKTALIILDGWGHGNPDEHNAIHVAKTPCVDDMNARVPHASLRTDGEHVGLPQGQMGNSEVGHMNIGAGRVVYQDLCASTGPWRQASWDKSRCWSTPWLRRRKQACVFT